MQHRPSDRFPGRLAGLYWALSLALALSACGGGGESATPTATQPTATTPVVGNSGTTTPAATPASNTAGVTYPVDSAERGGWDTLQAARSACGFGVLSQNAQLDAAALAHANYQVAESFATGTALLTHYETNTANAYYTGYQPWDRSRTQGYGARVAEILEATTWNYDTRNAPTLPSAYTRGHNSMRSLLNTVYHLQGAMYYGLDVGFGVVLQNQTSGTSVREEYRFGSLNGFQTRTHTLGAGALASYPCAGVADVPPSFTPANESPNPFPSMTTSSQVVGPPIYFKADAGQTLTLQSVTVTHPSGTPVATYVLDTSNDPVGLSTGKPDIGPHEVFVVPTAPLAASTRYAVSASGLVGATPVSTQFSFTTGPN